MLMKSDGKTCLNPCSIRHGGCSHACTNTDTGADICSCPQNLVLDSDYKTCVKPCKVNGINCSHTCTNAQDGRAVCTCPPGMALKSDEKTCAMQCSVNNGGCSHKCVNGKNGAQCLCPESMVPAPNKTTCVKPCDLNNGDCSHICKNTEDGRAICSCQPGLPLGSDGRTCSQTFSAGYRCGCSIHAEIYGTKKGSILFDLPTLLYGYQDLWAEDINGTFKVLDRYPNFNSKLVRRQLSQEEYKKCLSILQSCPFDCERMAKAVIDDGLSTVLTIRGSSGSKTIPLGQIMCERLLAPLHPGRRPIVFFDPGPKCGRPVSTHSLPDALCCGHLRIPGLLETYVWNKKCDGQVSIKDLIAG